MILFVIASAINGMAPSLFILDISRGIQAVGGAGMMSLSMALVASNFDGKERGLALGILGSIIGVSSASGPLIGGYLVEHFGWPAIFYVNVPFGILSVILTIFYVRETPSYGKDHKIDLAGMFLSAIGLFAVIYGLIVKEGHPHWAWVDGRVSGLIAGGIVIMAFFVWVEMRVEDPMIDIKMFKRPHFLGTILIAFALGSGIYAYNAFLTALMQNYIGYSAVQTGVRQLTISAWSLVLGPVAGILSSRYSKKWMIVGSMLLGGIGFFLMAHSISPLVTFVELWPGMVLMGIANGMVNPLLNTAGMEGTLPQEMGMVSGLLNVFRQFGTTVGVVGLGLIQDTQYENHLNAHMPDLEMPTKVMTAIKEALINAGPFSGHTIAFSNRMAHMPFAGSLQKVVIQAYDNGMAAVAVTSGMIVIVGGIGAALLMKNHVDSVHLDVNQHK